MKDVCKLTCLILHHWQLFDIQGGHPYTDTFFDKLNYLTPEKAEKITNTKRDFETWNILTFIDISPDT